MTTKKATRRPPIQMIDAEADSLAELAMTIEDRLPQVSELLLNEITRAKLHPPSRIPSDVVTMHATVKFLDQASGREYDYELTYPNEADISKGRISILTPVGAGLIGLRAGQSILWPDKDGHERDLTIISVTQAAREV